MKIYYRGYVINQEHPEAAVHGTGQEAGPGDAGPVQRPPGRDALGRPRRYPPAGEGRWLARLSGNVGLADNSGRLTAKSARLGVEKIAQHTWNEGLDLARALGRCSVVSLSHPVSPEMPHWGGRSPHGVRCLV